MWRCRKGRRRGGGDGGGEGGGDLWSLSERYGEIPLGLGLARMEGGRLQEEGGG
jgi:hypothetical protein